MPPLSVPYPSVTVVNKRTYCDIRALVVARTGSSMVAAPAEDYSVELLTGSKGNAVIVRKEEVRIEWTEEEWKTLMDELHIQLKGFSLQEGLSL